MNPIDDKPAMDETVIYRTKCHGAMMLGPIVVVIIGCLALRSQGFNAGVLIAFGLIWGALAYNILRRSHLELTRSGVSITAGFPVPVHYDIPTARIEAIDFYQPALGSMLDFGKVLIVDKQRGKSIIKFVSGPAEFVMRVREQLIALAAPPTDNP